MRKHSLEPNKGLSLSQAQSISNLCNQRVVEINQTINSINNYTKQVRINELYTLQKGIHIPENIVELLIQKSELSACQAFLMENIKAKQYLLDKTKLEQADISGVPYPSKRNYMDITYSLLNEVNEQYGWNQLSRKEYNEYLEAEAYAAHIGKFIHKNGKLDELRKELPSIPEIEWMEIETGKKTPVNIKVHHTSDGLLKLHEKLANIHRVYEQKVNYFKAKVKNIVTEENTRIAKHNNDLQIKAEEYNNNVDSDFHKEVKLYDEKIKTIKSEFEIYRQKTISEYVLMRIVVDDRFKETIDMFLNELPKEQK